MSRIVWPGAAPGGRSGARGAAAAGLVAAVREQAVATRAAAATAGAEAKPGVPPGSVATPMPMAPACHAAALALQAGPAVGAGTGPCGSWPACVILSRYMGIFKRHVVIGPWCP